jgi:Tn3 transposase DDE domain-containing protein
VFGLRTTEVSQAEIFPLQISLVYINTLMLQQVLVEPTWQGRLTTTDLRALTPLKWQHVTPYGTFTLNIHKRLVLERAA